MNYILSCIFAGLKATVGVLLVIVFFALPVYLFLAVSYWFGIVILLEMFFVVGVLLKAADRYL